MAGRWSIGNENRLGLADHEFLGLLTPEERADLLSQARVKRFPGGRLLFQKGDPGDKLFIIASGLVSIGVVTEEGKHLVFNVLGRGEVFGEIALLDGGLRTADATAMSDCELLVVERSDVIPFLERHPETTARVISMLCKRVRWISQNLEDALGSDVPRRLARKLVTLSNVHGIPSEDGGIDIQLKLPQQDLANMIGVSRESVNKHLKAWTDLGWISVRRGHVTIGDIDCLKALAETVD